MDDTTSFIVYGIVAGISAAISATTLLDYFNKQPNTMMKGGKSA